MAEILKKDDFKRVELLNLITKKGHLKNLNSRSISGIRWITKRRITAMIKKQKNQNKNS